MEPFYTRTPIDFYTTGAAIENLDQSLPPAEDIYSVWNSFKNDIKIKRDNGDVVLAVTVTIHPRMKSKNGRLVWDQSPQRQADVIREKLEDACTKYNRKYNTGLLCYFFFESTQLGKTHAHGIVAHADTQSYYPIYIGQFASCLSKVGFRKIGYRVEYVRHYEEYAAYISKDVHITKGLFRPLYIRRSITIR